MLMSCRDITPLPRLSNEYNTLKNSEREPAQSLWLHSSYWHWKTQFIQFKSQIFKCRVGIYRFCQIPLQAMSHNSLSDPIIHTAPLCLYCKCMPRTVRCKTPNPHLFHYIIKFPSILIISHSGSILASCIIEKHITVEAVHSLIISCFYQWFNIRMWNFTVYSI